MKLTEKLIGYLNRVFDKNPAQVLALRLRYDGSAMTWSIADGVLRTSVTGGSGTGLVVELSRFSVAELGVFLAAQPGYSVPYQDLTTFSGLSALVLLDGDGDQDASNGDHLHGYTSVLWSYMESVANELTLIRTAIQEALLQMAAPTATAEWVDEHGGYYNVERIDGETDSNYARRIVVEVLRARGNNVAIGEALKAAVGADAAYLTDYGTITVAGDGTKSYGLFDVTVESGTDIEMAEQEDVMVRAIIESLRDAGTHLRKLKYIRKNPWFVYVGAALRYGVDATVFMPSSTPSVLQGATIVASTRKLIQTATRSFQAKSGATGLTFDVPFSGDVADSAALMAWLGATATATVPIFYNQANPSNNLIPVGVSAPSCVTFSNTYEGGVRCLRTGNGALKSVLASGVLSAFTVYIKGRVNDHITGGVYTLLQQGSAFGSGDRFTSYQNWEDNDHWACVAYRSTGAKYGKGISVGSVGATESYCITFDLAGSPQVRVWKNGVEQTTPTYGASPSLVAALAAHFWSFGAAVDASNCSNHVFTDIVVFETAKTPTQIAALFALLG
jgi:hypothetical protein